MNRISIFLDTFARPRCIECDVLLTAGCGPLCPTCNRQLPWWRTVDGCPRCGTPAPIRQTADAFGRDDGVVGGCSGCLMEGSALHACHALIRYEGSVRRWIPGFKSARSPFGPTIALRLVIDHLAVELARRTARETSARPDLVVSVPLHPRRRRWRAFNHVDPIARRIAQHLGGPWLPDALERTRDTRAQATLVGRERRENMRHAFRATRRLGPATHIWLVDDVLTTGSTLDAAADALLEAGALEVRALTIAATLPGGRAAGRRAVYHAAPQNDRSHGSK